MRIKHLLIFSILFAAACKQPYEPPAIKAANHYLVVEGVINTLPDSKTSLQLSRTKNLVDTLLTQLETGATVKIEARSGATYLLQPQADRYEVEHLSLNPADFYRLRIFTSDGTEFLSDYVPVKQTPPIDSLTWKQAEDVTISVNTRDPQAQSRYYRWDYTETWQYRSFLESNFGLGVANGRIYFLDANTQVTTCWSTAPSTEITLASSAKLSEDVIDHFPVVVIPNHSIKLGMRYSALVRQYALTEDASQYWEILQKNSQSLGTLFDAQPGQLKSNLHNVKNPDEPVIGYVSACNVQEKRLFIDRNDLVGWVVPVESPYCGEMVIGQNTTDPFLWEFADTTYGPWFFVSPGSIRIAKKECLDCRRKGGTNQKPSFW